MKFYLALPQPYKVNIPTVPTKAIAFMASLFCIVLCALHLVFDDSKYQTTPMAAKLPTIDHPMVVQTLSRLACINSLFPSSESSWKAILGLSLYFSSKFVSFVYLFVLCSRSGLSNLYSPVASLTFNWRASSLSRQRILSRSTSLVVVWVSSLVMSFEAATSVISNSYNIKLRPQ